VLFGDHVTSAVGVAPAGWIDEACGGAGWTVGALVPNGYQSVLRISAPDPEVQSWWSAYRDLYGVAAEIGRQHTSSPDRAWFAIWDGHGFANSITQVAWRGPLDDNSRRALEERRRTLRVESERRNAAIRTALQSVPTFELPGRRYYLLTGAVSAVTELRYPGVVEWRNPDLFWPDDRRWFAATDVDFWSVYVGGDDDFLGQLATSVPTECEVVDLDRRLEVED
jgi:hypothetical protein